MLAVVPAEGGPDRERELSALLECASRGKAGGKCEPYPPALYLADGPPGLAGEFWAALALETLLDADA